MGQYCMSCSFKVIRGFSACLILLYAQYLQCTCCKLSVHYVRCKVYISLNVLSFQFKIRTLDCHKCINEAFLNHPSVCMCVPCLQREGPLCSPMTPGGCSLLVSVRHQEVGQLVPLCEGQTVGHLLVHQRTPEQEVGVCEGA